MLLAIVLKISRVLNDLRPYSLGEKSIYHTISFARLERLGDALHAQNMKFAMTRQALVFVRSSLEAIV